MALFDEKGVFDKICKLSWPIRGHILRWDSKRKRLSADVSKNSLKTNRLIRYFKRVYATAMVLQVIFTNYNKNDTNTSITDKTEIAFYLAAMIANDFQLHECWKKASEIVLYINGIVSFGEKYSKGQKKKWKSYTLLEKLNIGIAFSMYITATIFAFNFVFLQHWNDPCKSFFPGYQLLDECHIFNITGNMVAPLKYIVILFIKLIVLIFNYISFNVGVQSAAFVIGCLQSICTITLCAHIATFNKLWTANEIPKLDAILIHMEVQVMATVFNEIQQGSLMMAAIVQPVILLAICSFTLLKTPWNGNTIGALGLFLLAVIDTVLVLSVTLGGMAKVHNASKEAIEVMKRFVDISSNDTKKIIPTKKIKLHRKFVESCSPIKIKFGTNNFVENDTPLNCIRHAFDLTVQLILLGA
ncbi:unnamed protein product [Orchesella dallaii]|uniref:Odorant receptor n=1 Tax=Orchesella dallaii TaxID=48710 RepID=A0ABP1RK74_9HEXA